MHKGTHAGKYVQQYQTGEITVHIKATQMNSDNVRITEPSSCAKRNKHQQ